MKKKKKGPEIRYVECSRPVVKVMPRRITIYDSDVVYEMFNPYESITVTEDIAKKILCELKALYENCD